MTDTLAKLEGRVRARVRRGAGARHSLTWWWLWERQERLQDVPAYWGGPNWSGMAAELTKLGVRVTAPDLQATWAQVIEEGEGERDRMTDAAAKRRHAKAWKVEGKLPRNPKAHAKRLERIERERTQRQARKELKERLAGWSASVCGEP